MSTTGSHAGGKAYRAPAGALVLAVALLWVALGMVTLPAAGAAQPLSVAVEQLATIGLADVQQRKVVEVCASLDGLQSIELTARVDFRIDLEPEVAAMLDFTVGPITFKENATGTLCVDNTQLKIDVVSGTLDYREFQHQLDSLFAALDSPTIPYRLNESSEIPSELPTVQQVIQTIIGRGGLLPAFHIALQYGITGYGAGGAIEDKTTTVYLDNTNPEPATTATPSDGDEVTSLRPSLTWDIPEIPRGVTELSATLWLDDITPGSTGPAWAQGMRATIRPPGGSFPETVTFTYPRTAEDLIPGHRYRQRLLLADPVGRAVGVGADPAGEQAEFTVAVEPIEPEEPGAGEALRELHPRLSWSDPNPASISAGFSGMRLLVGEQASLQDAWVMEAGGSSSYEYADAGHPLQPGRTYYWAVVPLDRRRSRIEVAGSSVRSFSIEQLPALRVAQPSEGARFAEGAEPVRLELEPLPEWRPALQVEWFDQGRAIGTGAELEVALPAGTHRIHAEAYLPELPALRVRSAPVGVEVVHSLSAPVVAGLPRSSLFFAGTPFTVEVPASAGGVPPYSLAVSVSGDEDRTLAEQAGLVEGARLSLTLPALRPGGYELRAVLRDSAGGEREAVQTFELAAPALSIEAVAGEALGASPCTGGGQENFLTTDTLRLYLCALDPSSGGTPLDPAVLPLRFEWTVGGTAAAGAGPVTVAPGRLTGGTHRVEVTARHGAAGEVAAAERVIYVSAADLSPGVSVAKSGHLWGDTVEVTVGFHPAGAPPYRVDVLDDGQVVASSVPITQPPVSIPVAALDPGAHRLSARVRDGAGSMAVSEPIEVSIARPRIAAFRVVDDAGIERSSAQPGDALRVEMGIEADEVGAGAGGAAEFVERAGSYRLEILLSVDGGAPKVAASTPDELRGLSLDPAALAGPGRAVAVTGRLYVRLPGGETLVDEREARLAVLAVAVPVDLEIESERIELAEGEREGDVEAGVVVGRAGVYGVEVQALRLDARGEVLPGQPPIVERIDRLEVPGGGGPGRAIVTVHLAAGSYRLVAAVRAVEVDGVEAGQRFEGPARTLQLVRARTGDASVVIRQPQPGRYAEDRPVPFEAAATDPFGGSAADLLVWTRRARGSDRATAIEIGRGATFAATLPEGMYTIEARFSLAGEDGGGVGDEAYAASVDVEVFAPDNPSVGAVVSVNAARGALYRARRGEDSTPIGVGGIVASGWAVEARANPGVLAGSEIGRVSLVRPARVIEQRTERWRDAGGPADGEGREYSAGQSLSLRAGYTYTFLFEAGGAGE